MEETAAVPELLTERELAMRTRKSERSWQSLRMKGGGPPYYRLDGRTVRYDWQDVLRWLGDRRFSSTSEEALHGR